MAYIDPTDTSHDDQGRSQGVWTSGIATGYDGNTYKWTGASWEAQNTGGGGGGGGRTASYPKSPFTDQWFVENNRLALEQLTPYYEEKLKRAGGDVERAKRLIEEDYTRGVRYSKEDLTRENIQGEENAATAFKTLGLDVAEENRNLQGSLNQRNVLLGTIPQGDTGSAAPMGEYAKSWFINPQTERQDLRKLAIERALKRQKEVAGTTATREQEGLTTQRARGIEEQYLEYTKFERELNKTNEQEAFNVLAPNIFNQKYATYKAVNNLA